MIMHLCVSEPYFVSQISQPPGIAQNWSCIQNLPMDLSFKEEKTVCNFVLWFLKYQIKLKVVFFLGHPVVENF